MRQGIWTDRVNMISGHNEEADAGVHSFRLGENHLADFTSEEIVSMMNGISLDFDPSNNKAEVSEDETSGLPDSVDWRTKVRELNNRNLITPIKCSPGLRDPHQGPEALRLMLGL